MRIWARAALVCGLLLHAGMLHAHDLRQSESIFEARGAAVAATITIDLLGFPGVDDDRNGRVSYDELDAAIADVFARLKTLLRVQADVPPSRITLDRHDLVEDDHILRLVVTYAYPRPVAAITVISSLDQLGDPMHQHLVTAIVGEARQRAILDRSNPSATLSMTTARVTAARVAAAVAGLLAVGALVWLRLRRGRSQALPQR
jgi:hypothetical protein